MTTVAEIRRELAALEDPKARAVNERHGDDHGVNLTKLRAVAKATGRDPVLARELWATDDTAARLVSLLIAAPKQYDADELDTMLREARARKVQDWLVNYVVKKSPHREQLRLAWLADDDVVIEAAGWDLTSDLVVKSPSMVDPSALLDEIEARMAQAPDRLQWAMNQCLAMIGIERPDLRDRAVAIGERLGVLRDYPTPPNCTSPYAPAWIGEMVRRQGE